MTIIPFDKNTDRYRKLALEHAEKEDFIGALGFLFSAKSINNSPEIMRDIADTYAEMGLFELSNKYLFSLMQVVPKDEHGDIFVDLGVNYFYSDNFMASGYYLEKKISIDGFLPPESVDPEIIEFFSGEHYRKTAYRIVYPFDKADFSPVEKRGKALLANGQWEQAVKIFESIPIEARKDDVFGDLAMAYFFSDKLDEAEEVCKESIEILGENVTAYCNLSTIYSMREDNDKKEYYYQKALSVKKGEKTEPYRLATCAIECLDHVNVRDCISKILQDRPYDLVMRFFYGISLLNLLEFEKAQVVFKEILLITPDDFLVREYNLLTSKLINNRVDSSKYLPIKYLKNLPERTIKKYVAEIKEIASKIQDIDLKLKKQENLDKVKWGIYYGDDEVLRLSAYLLALNPTPKKRQIVNDLLMDTDARSESKTAIVYMLLVSGAKGKIKLVFNDRLIVIRPKKTIAQSQDLSGIFTSAYALCVSRLMGLNVDLDKIAKVLDQVFLAIGDKISNAEVSNHELSALILSECAFPMLNDKQIAKFFSISERKLAFLKKFYKGEKND